MFSFVPSFWVVALPLLGAVTVALLGMRYEKVVPGVAAAIGVANAVVGLLMVPRMIGGKSFSFPWLPGISDFSVVPDALGATVALAASVLGALILIYSLSYMEREEGKIRYYALVLIFIGAMSGLTLSGSLLSLFFFWEICGICSFALVGFHYEDPKALAGALKAFITTKIGDIGLMSGIMVLYFSSAPHTFDIATILERSIAGEIPPHLLAFSAFAMLWGAMGKSAQVPLHVWLPDAMEAPTSVSALIHAATMVNAGVYLVARMFPAFSVVPGWSATVTWVGAITLLLAALMAVAAKDLKRMLAYSTVSQLGYMFFAVGTGSILASQFHLVSHAIFKALLFLAAGALIHEAGTRDMSLLSGAGKKMPLTGRLFLVGVMGLTGIPMMGGFFSKDMIFAGALSQKAYVPLTVAVLGAILTFTYSWRAYLRVFCGEPSKALHHAHEVHLSMVIPMAVLGVGSVGSWLLIGVLSKKMHETLHALEIHVISPIYLLEETFLSPAFLLSVVAITFGFILVRRRDVVFAWCDNRASKFMQAAYMGFYFDAFYSALLGNAGKAAGALAHLIAGAIDGAISVGSFLMRHMETLTETFDQRYIEGIGRVLTSIVSWGSRKAIEFDSGVIEGSGRAMVSGIEKSSDAVHRSQNGDLNGNIVKLLIGLAVVLFIILIETGVSV